ncbi:hypothetical protein ACQFX9_20445 [Aliinostoc sp. HNIBRCY26]|uniref:hypothetical protein n=1 Tax=Aliinostoc sp. HNIBRCY26 TaxID=3418997 RepID=UPI003D03E200
MSVKLRDIAAGFCRQQAAYLLNISKLRLTVADDVIFQWQNRVGQKCDYGGRF